MFPHPKEITQILMNTDMLRVEIGTTTTDLKFRIEKSDAYLNS